MKYAPGTPAHFERVNIRGRMYDDLRGRPLYFVQKSWGIQQNQPALTGKG